MQQDEAWTRNFEERRTEKQICYNETENERECAAVLEIMGNGAGLRGYRRRIGTEGGQGSGRRGG